MSSIRECYLLCIIEAPNAESSQLFEVLIRFGLYCTVSLPFSHCAIDVVHYSSRAILPFRTSDHRCRQDAAQLQSQPPGSHSTRMTGAIDVESHYVYGHLSSACVVLPFHMYRAIHSAVRDFNHFSAIDLPRE